MNDSEGGEIVCYLSELAEDGTILDPRSAVRTSDVGGRMDQVRIGPDSLAPLMPLEGESNCEYRTRLQSPAERTAAWSVALAALDRPVVLSSAMPVGHLEVLAEFIRSLLTDD